MKPWLAGKANGKYLGEVKCQHCDEPAEYKRKALCRKHYDAIRHRGTVEPYVKPRDYCVVCSTMTPKPLWTPVKGHGLCTRHYNQWKRQGYVYWGKASGGADRVLQRTEVRSEPDDLNRGGST